MLGLGPPLSQLTMPTIARLEARVVTWNRRATLKGVLGLREERFEKGVEIGTFRDPSECAFCRVKPAGVFRREREREITNAVQRATLSRTQIEGSQLLAKLAAR